MSTETIKEMYCSHCDKTRKHIKVSYADIQAMKNLTEEYYRKHPNDIRAKIYENYPGFLKDLTLTGTAGLSVAVNGVGRYFTHKDVFQCWVCKKCYHFQTRVFED